MTFTLSNKDNYLWYTMITDLTANFAQVSATQTECYNELWNAPKNKGLCGTKRHKVIPAMQ